MNLKNRFKRFWTLDVHNHEGFTLVELIIVIAILAILSTGAIAGYSAYVEKASMQADMTLINEIELALQLAYYSQDLPEGSAGFIMLSPNVGESVAGDDSETGNAYIAPVLEKTFGSNWMNTLQLKYDDWGVKNMALSYEDATAVVNSNFVQKYSPEEMLGRVQELTNLAQGLQGAMTELNEDVDLYDMYNYTKDGKIGNAIGDLITEHYGNSKTWDELSPTEQSNLLVLATASDITDGNGSLASNIIMEYSFYTAYAAENPTFNEAYKTFMTNIEGVTDINVLQAEFGKLENAGGKEFEDWKNKPENSNGNAFKAIMAGVGNAVKDNGDAIFSELGEADMFTNGIGSELYNDYLNSAYAAAGLPGVANDFYFDGEAPEGSVLIQYVVNQGKLYIANSIPIR